MDPTNQVAETAARGMTRGLYADIRTTWRGPMVNSIWRVLAAHNSSLTQYIWSQVKPVFQTREFAAFSISFRDTILSGVEPDLPQYSPTETNIDPAAFTVLQGQLETFDVVAPRLAVYFYVMDRRLNDRTVGTATAGDAATAPFPEWLDRDRGRPPTMLSHGDSREKVPSELSSGFGDMVPSIYRCLAQWPAFLDTTAPDIQHLIDLDSYDTATSNAFSLVDTFLDRLPYTPRTDPDALAGIGESHETISDLQDLFATFRRGGTLILPILHLYPATVSVAGTRSRLTFP